MFERLTKKVFINGAPYFIDTVGNDVEAGDMTAYQIGVALKRLAAYEDSGLSPEQVRELAKAKTNGRLVVLPCKVGQIVYADCGGDIIGWEICEIKLSSDAPDKYYTCGDDDGYAADEMYFEESDIGKTVFLTREEAEKAIAEVINK